MNKNRSDPLFLKICFFSYPDEVLTPLLSSYADVTQPSLLRPVQRHLISTKHITLDNTSIKLFLVDISTDPFVGSYRARNLVGSSAVVFVFSKNDTRFFDSTKDLFRKLKHHIPDLPLYIAFIGLLGDSDTIPTSTGQDLAHELGGDYFEMAPNDLQTFDTLVRSLARKGMEKYLDDLKGNAV